MSDACCFCLENLTDPSTFEPDVPGIKILRCLHRFHEACMMFYNESRCPICRTETKLEVALAGPKVLAETPEASAEEKLLEEPEEEKIPHDVQYDLDFVFECLGEKLCKADSFAVDLAIKRIHKRGYSNIFYSMIGC